MDEAFDIRRETFRLFRLDRIAGERVGEDVLGLDQLGRARPRQQIDNVVLGMAHADMAEGIDDAFIGQDAVGGDQLVDQRF
jgi:predicted DNA-binding transcriptional regulator YafY